MRKNSDAVLFCFYLKTTVESNNKWRENNLSLLTFYKIPNSSVIERSVQPAVEVAAKSLRPKLAITAAAAATSC